LRQADRRQTEIVAELNVKCSPWQGILGSSASAAAAASRCNASRWIPDADKSVIGRRAGSKEWWGDGVVGKHGMLHAHVSRQIHVSVAVHLDPRCLLGDHVANLVHNGLGRDPPLRYFCLPDLQLL
jgi:hypothetical protein